MTDEATEQETQEEPQGERCVRCGEVGQEQRCRRISMRTIYRLLSWPRWANAIQRGPAAVARREARLQGYRFVNRMIGQGRRRR